MMFERMGLYELTAMRTTLFTPFQACTIVLVTTGTAIGAVVTYPATLGPTGATCAVTEAGVLNASSVGTLLCRTVFAVVNKGADDAMGITWAITDS